ncbi:hypothetical protein D2E23_1735 [Bifidobacterium callimiconis]|uniref:Uncharacterized protein n=1 Tax=Bifidobacterium callimiconis TaxID=2306973 RepID=A0A430FBH3_9BIFI|nr:hypothetical protein D2E23_1735 [Bifidobacterium callimiconis]
MLPLEGKLSRERVTDEVMCERIVWMIGIVFDDQFCAVIPTAIHLISQPCG